MFETISNYLISMGYFIIPFLFILLVVVFVHELGHFIVGRLCGVRITTFSLGFGPELFGFEDKKGTRWRVAAIPLGGYVKFFGDANAASMPDAEKIALMPPEERAGSFFHKPVWKRTLVVAAGPLANFLFAILVFAGIFMFYGSHLPDPLIGKVRPATAAEAAGLRQGDLILAIDRRPVTQFSDVRKLVQERGGQSIGIEVKRGDQTILLHGTPASIDVEDEDGRLVTIGSLGIEPARQRDNPWVALQKGTSASAHIITSTLAFVGRLIVGEERADRLRGIIGIADITASETSEAGFIGLVNLLARISVSIGLLNLFPIPLLDGGHLVFYAYEWLRGRPLGERSQEILFRLGLLAILFLMVFAAWNDIGRLMSG